MKSFRLIKGELDKIFVRPAIFVMTFFFIVAIVLSALIFTPSPRTDNRISMDAKNVQEVYDAFYSSTGTYQFKNTFDEHLNIYKKILQFYTSPSNTSITKSSLLSQANDLRDKFNKFYGEVLKHTPSTDTTSLKNALNNLVSSVTTLKTTLSNINKSYITILLTNDSYNSLVNNSSYIYQASTTFGDEQNYEYYRNIANRIYDNDWINSVVFVVENDINDISVKQDTLDTLNEKLTNVTNVTLPNILTEFDNYHNQIIAQGETIAKNKDNIQTALNLASNYKLAIYEISDLINYSILVEICNSLPIDNIKSYYGSKEFQEYEQYKYKEKITRINYLLETNTYEYQYANVLQTGVSSTYETNAYDYMYYAMELLSILIMLYCVILGADMIAGEQASGTLKALAIRPYKRSKILNAKVMATIIFGIIFVVIGMIASYIIGAFTYGIDNTNVLVTFNASSSFVVSPIMLLLIYFATLLIRIIFFTIIAVFLSTLFKSNIASITISFILYLIIAVFATILKGTIIYRYLPFNNADLFKYFGGEFQNSGVNATFFGLDFTPPLVADMSFYFSLIISMGFAVLLLLFTHWIFKTRDIT